MKVWVLQGMSGTVNSCPAHCKGKLERWYKLDAIFSVQNCYSFKFTALFSLSHDINIVNSLQRSTSYPRNEMVLQRSLLQQLFDGF